MLNAAEARKEIFDVQIGHGERVTAGDQYIADFFMFLDVVEAGFPGFYANMAFILCHHPCTCAIPAVGRTESCNEEQHTVGIAVNNIFNRAVMLF